MLSTVKACQREKGRSEEAQVLWVVYERDEVDHMSPRRGSQVSLSQTHEKQKETHENRKEVSELPNMTLEQSETAREVSEKEKEAHNITDLVSESCRSARIFVSDKILGQCIKRMFCDVMTWQSLGDTVLSGDSIWFIRTSPSGQCSFP